MIDLSDIEIIDFHAHAPRTMGIKEYLATGEELKDDYMRTYGWQRTLVRYVADSYGCVPTLDAIDEIVSRKVKVNFDGYVRDILDREKIGMVNLDLFGERYLGETLKDESFPKDRMTWTLGVTPLLLPDWTKNQGAKNLDQAVDLVKQEMDKAVKNGCCGFKSMAAYFRSLSVEKVSRGEASAAYKRLLKTKPKYRRVSVFIPEIPVYKTSVEERSFMAFQDYLLREMLVHTGQHGRVFFFHTGSIDYPSCDLRNVSPSHFYSILSDEEVRKTKIVILHAGYPFYREAAVMAIQFPNLYIDASFVSYFHGLYRDVLKNIVEIATYTSPSAERIVYGSDAYGMAEKLGWAARATRTALAEVLDELVEKCKWDEDGCLKLAEMIMNKNAKKLLPSS